MTQSRKGSANSHWYASSRVKLGWLVVIILMALVLFYYFTYYYSATGFWTSSSYQKRGRTRLISTDLYKQTAEKAREQRPELNSAELKETDAYAGTDAVETDHYLPVSSERDFEQNPEDQYNVITSEFGVVFGDDEAIYDETDLEEEEVAVFDETIYEELEEEGFVFGDDETSYDEAEEEEEDEDVELATNDELWYESEIEESNNDSGTEVLSKPSGIYLPVPTFTMDQNNNNLQENSSSMHADINAGFTDVAVKNRESFFVQLDHYANHSNPNCAMSNQFNSWRKGVVSQLGPPLKRNCLELRKNPKAEMERVHMNAQVKNWKSNKPWQQFAIAYKKKSCKEIRHEFQNNFYVSQTEKDFPLAYIFVVYTNAGQILRLLKAIYRPHNLYCIHPDARQGNEFASFFKAVAKCLDNVFVVSKPVRVYYGHISITNAQLNCMSDLEKYPATRWKYVINLCGREIPLKTNREIVESLKKLNGYTALNLGHLTPNFWTSRFKFKYNINKKGNMYRTHQRQSKPPKGIKIYKSMNFIAASRQFVRFLLYNPLSTSLHMYLGTVYVPEEHFYSSLYALPQAKGAKPPTEVATQNEIPTVDKSIWITTKWHKRNLGFYCPGRRVVHSICILTTRDLERVQKIGMSTKYTPFFFNKYFLEWDPTPMDCMEERLVTTNVEEYQRDCVHVDRHTTA